MMLRAALLGLLALAAAGARAQDVASFYQGRQMRLVSGSSASESTALYERLLARFLPRYIPGNPAIVAETLPGAGGLNAANMVANVAPRDGSVIGTAHGFVPLMQLFGLEGPRFDPDQLFYLGSMYRLTGLCVGMKRDGVASLADLRARETLVGTSGPGTEIITFYNTLRKMLGARLKVIRGYASSAHINLAMERHEVQGRGAFPWVLLKATKAEWLKDGKLSLLAHTSLEPLHDAPNVPRLVDLAPNEDARAVFELMAMTSDVGRPFAMPPGAPADRVTAVRRAFDAMVKDPEFIADAAQIKEEVEPKSGEDLQDLVRRIVNVQPSTIARFRAALANKS